MKQITTLCIVHNHPRVLLGMKKRGFGEGRWNGFGGKVAEGESIEEAAYRELAEEAGIVPQELEKRGVLEFAFEHDPLEIEMHIFNIAEFSGDPREGEEMKPAWFHVDDIPYDDMWPDDKHWLPHFLEGKEVAGSFLFGAGDVIVENNLRVD